MGNLEGIFRGFFLTHRTKAQKFRGKFQSIFRKKIRSSKKILRTIHQAVTCGRQSRCLGWTYKLPGSQKFNIKLPLFLWISTEKTFKFNKKTPVYKLPRGAIYKPPCVQLINNLFFLLYIKFLHCQLNAGFRDRKKGSLQKGPFHQRNL